MSLEGRAAALLLNALLLGSGPKPAWGQHVHWSAQAVGVVSDVSPAINGRDLTEGYLTQPVLMGMLMHGPVTLQGTVDLEGLTLMRGELNAGIWGEGYADRRHPHTYLHEAMLTARHDFGALSSSLSAGRGFAPFGSDDPMVRYFVEYPGNHHLSQILERWVVMGALRFGPVVAEAGTFNGDEPTGPRSLGHIDRFGDAFSGRLTLLPLSGVEVSASGARVSSPELVTGGGLDQHKLHASVRAERAVGSVNLYGLAEYARTGVFRQSSEVFVYTSHLGEVSAQRGGWRISARYENSVRPEEERLANPFRTLRPPTDHSIVGRTRFRTTSLQLAYSLRSHGLAATPFVEMESSHASAVDQPAIVDPQQFYGSNVISTLSFGVRVAAGMPHMRMGRYGVAERD